jgi:uncharacterized protein (DUF58 family)
MGAAVTLTPPRVLHRLEWQVLRRLDGRLHGEHRSAFRGSGVDILDVRDYEPGDDVRHIDWNVTARMDAPYVRQFLEDREITAWLLLDRSPSMSFGPIERPKSLVLTELAGSIAALLARGGNRVGAVLFDHAVAHTLAPRRGRNQTLHLIDRLLAAPRPSSGPTDLGRLLAAATTMIRRRSLIVLASDFISETGWERPLGTLAQRHDVIALRLVDRREFALPDAGPVVFEDAETGERLVVDTNDPKLHRRLRDAVDQREAALRAAATRAGVPLLTITTDDDPVDALVRVVTTPRYRRAR